MDADYCKHYVARILGRTCVLQGTCFFCDGFIITCWHVVSNLKNEGSESEETWSMDSVEVEFPSKQKIKCKVIYPTTEEEVKFGYDICVLMPINEREELYYLHSTTPNAEYITDENKLEIPVSPYYVISSTENTDTKTASSDEGIRLFLSPDLVNDAKTSDGKKVKLQYDGEDFESDIDYIDETFAIVSVHGRIAQNIKQALKSTKKN